MTLNQKIKDFAKDDQIPYRWMFFQNEICFDDLSQPDLEWIFKDLYASTRLAFEAKKQNAYNLLFNILWLDECVSNYNWEYSNLNHYKKRLLDRFNYVKVFNPVTIKSFLNLDKATLSCLLINIQNGQIVFLEGLGNWGSEHVVASNNIASSDIAISWQNELMLMLEERISDKLKYVNLLLDNESERNSVFSPKEIGQTVPKNTTREVRLVEAPKNEVNKDIQDGELLTVTSVDSNSANRESSNGSINTDISINTIDPVIEKLKTELPNIDIGKIVVAIEGEGLLKRFYYLAQNIELATRTNANRKLIKYSAIYFALQDHISNPKVFNEHPTWCIHKKELREALGLVLKTSIESTGIKHVNKVKELLGKYKQLDISSL